MGFKGWTDLSLSLRFLQIWIGSLSVGSPCFEESIRSNFLEIFGKKCVCENSNFSLALFLALLLSVYERLAINNNKTYSHYSSSSSPLSHHQAAASSKFQHYLYNSKPTTKIVYYPPLDIGHTFTLKNFL